MRHLGIWISRLRTEYDNVLHLTADLANLRPLDASEGYIILADHLSKKLYFVVRGTILSSWTDIWNNVQIIGHTTPSRIKVLESAVDRVI